MFCSKKTLSLVLVVDKQANRVLWAESGGDVVDVLLSFLTLPLGTAVRVLGKKSGLGCVDELYKSVEALDRSYFQTPSCKDMLLRPRSAAERLCRDLPVKVDDGDPVFYACSNWSCFAETWPSVLSPVFGTCRRCFGDMDRIIRWRPSDTSTEAADGMFVDRRLRYCIADNLDISPVSTSTVITLVNRLGSVKSQLEQMTVELSRETVLKLLQKSLTSKTPLTDTFLRESEWKLADDLEQLHRCPTINEEEATAAGSGGWGFKARLVKNMNDRNKVMYAEVGGDTVDLLFSFLTFPLSSIVRLLPYLLHLGCMGSMHFSLLRSDISTKHMDTLLAPMIATHYGCSNQLLDVYETSFETTMNTCVRDCCAWIPPTVCMHLILPRTAVQANPKFRDGSTEKGGNFAKDEAGTFMVTDDMTVTPYSSLSAIRFLQARTKYLEDVVVEEVTIGKEEAQALLEGLLLTRTPLTYVFCRTKKE